MLPGVIGGRNQIKLTRARPWSPDAEPNVTVALLRNAQLEAQHVGVTVSGTEIRLPGHVARWAARHQAEYAIQSGGAAHLSWPICPS